MHAHTSLKLRTISYLTASCTTSCPAADEEMIVNGNAEDMDRERKDEKHKKMRKAIVFGDNTKLT